MTQMDSNTPAASWVPLTARERRVVGVMVEKAKTTPEYYPMTVAAIVSACNQKSNRDPITNYDADDVEETLHGLRKKGAAILIEGGGRVQRWKHTLYDWLKVTKIELAVIAELLLRGPQTEGELRARASRMEPLADLPALQAQVEALTPRNLIVYLTPPGQKRGAILTHGLYPPEELERLRQHHAQASAGRDPEEPVARLGSSRSEPAAPLATQAELAAVRAEVEGLKDRLEALMAEFRDLKSALGA